MKLSLSNSNELALIDDEDFERIPKATWRLNPYGYVIGYVKISKNVYNKALFLHKAILGCQPGFQIDHINLDKLDNRKSNLRVVTQQQNLMNRSLFKTNKLGLKGVCREGNRYRAYIRISGKRIHLGCFGDPIEAAKAYDKAAAHYFGDFARLNFS